MKIRNPHDLFFKEIFSDKENVVDLIEGVFPKKLKRNLLVYNLVLDNNSYIDEELKSSYSDIVYNCAYKGKAEIKVSLLFEHKSGIVDHPHLQLLKYMLNIWNTNLKQNIGFIPVIPVILYHGKGTWDKRRFEEYFKNIDRNLLCYIPEFSYVLVDLSDFRDDEIKFEIFNRVSTKITCLFLKNIFDEKVLRKYLQDFLMLGKLYYEEEKGLKFLESVLRYIYNATDIASEDVINVTKEISFKGGEIAMTTAMKLRKEGKREGKREEKNEIVVDLFNKENWPLEKIARFLKVDIKFVRNALEGKK